MGVDEVVVLVTGILRNQKREVLLLKRSKKNKTFVGFWHLPEGKIERTEQPIEALSREIQEELECRLISANLTATESTIITLGGRNYRLVRIVFDVQWRGKISLSEEHSAYCWVSISKALKLNHLVDGIKEVLLEVRKCRNH